MNPALFAVPVADVSGDVSGSSLQWPYFAYYRYEHTSVYFISNNILRLWKIISLNVFIFKKKHLRLILSN